MGTTVARIASVAMLTLALGLAAPRIAQAHESRDVGPYNFVVGWMAEPAIEGEKNGIDLRITQDGEP
ncbi:MAG: hypothetical protein WD734_01910, partial [Dehalococcoidia bacterium]